MNTEEIIAEITTGFRTLSGGSRLSVLKKHAIKYGAEKFFFGAALFSDYKPTPDYRVYNGYPDKWQKRYQEKNYFDEDLTVAHCKEKTTPILWPVHDSSISRINKKIFSEASEFGLEAGISLPFHSNNGEYGALALSVSGNFQKSSLSNPDNLFALQVLGATLFDRCRSNIKKNKVITLTKREKECLQWVAAGKTSWETGKILSISERTVVFHLQNAASKMDTTSRISAVVRAFLSGDISI